MTDTNQASEDELDKIIVKVYLFGINGGLWYEESDNELSPNDAKTAILRLISNEKLKLLDEVIHQSTINLKSAKAVAGWAELRKEQLEAEL